MEKKGRLGMRCLSLFLILASTMSSTFMTSFQYDYRKLCEDILPNCKFISVALASVTRQSLSAVLDQGKYTENINCILEIRTSKPISKYIADFDKVMASRFHLLCAINHINI
jgi:hypothetical protein